MRKQSIICLSLCYVLSEKSCSFQLLQRRTFWKKPDDTFLHQKARYFVICQIEHRCYDTNRILQFYIRRGATMFCIKMGHLVLEWDMYWIDQWFCCIVWILWQAVHLHLFKSLCKLAACLQACTGFISDSRYCQDVLTSVWFYRL